jgi:hypothetical protein
LKSANVRLEKAEKELANIDNEIKKFTKLSAEATSSATIERKLREYFGTGTNQDYWLVLPKDELGTDIIDEFEQEQTKVNIVRWWQLFY